MSEHLRLAMGQLNCLVGDIAGNVSQMIHAAKHARDKLRAHVIVFPELSLTGYPPEDLLLRPGLENEVAHGLQTLQAEIRDIDLIVGHPARVDDALYNAASWLRDGAIIATYHKQLLPNYSVFDEKRYFVPGKNPCVVTIQGVPVGVTICEDIWAPGPVQQAVQAGAGLIVNLNASPYHFNKSQEREHVVSQRVGETRVPIVYVNLVGGQDELVFDGESFVIDAQGRLTQRAPAFVTGVFLVEVEKQPPFAPVTAKCRPMLSEEESVYRALVLGVRDYVDKNGFPGVVLGLSGGIDSALTLAIAVDALGPARVQAVMMPSRYTSPISLEDAAAQAQTLGVKYSLISIEPMFEAFLAALKEEFRRAKPDSTEENIQARIRGVLLMAISNKTGKMVLTTGNKSEMAVGYATLYGDMAGGFAVIKDVLKTLVYRLVEYRNRAAPTPIRYTGSVIPQRIIARPPSAELAPDQRDTDSLPPYPVLDAILEKYIEHDHSVEDLVKAGFDPGTVQRVVAMIQRNEYKRRQAPPGVRITRRAFGRDWRYPITVGRGKKQKA
ncbi:MAG TPA: NAD+ synthase [Acidiferrobacterales bacterium]|nr:NAD+ synthase [Acidiferrobacterales bacterium]